VALVVALSAASLALWANIRNTGKHVAASPRQARPTQPLKGAAITWEQARKQIDDSYANQAIDSGWAKPAEERLFHALRGVAPKEAHVGPVVCKTSLCKADIAGNDHRKARDRDHGERGVARGSGSGLLSIPAVRS
jgi:hypothetical protein